MNWYDIHNPMQTDLLIGFYDLTGYTRLCRDEDDRKILDLMTGYFNLTGTIIANDNGILIKTIGDAGLAAFPAADIDRGVLAFRRVKSEGDAWLAGQGLQCRGIVKLNFGPVACGLVGAPGRERFDTYGHTVNTAALVESNGFAMTPQVFRKLSPDTRKLFKKHTPPISYIALEDRH